jgi:hypothetical protein
MKIAQLTVPTTVTPVEPVRESVGMGVQPSSQEYEEEEFVMKHELSADANAKMKRQLKMLKVSNPSLYSKIVNHQ